MKNSILIIAIMFFSILGFQSNYSFKEKPVVNYTLNNSLPVFVGDTISIEFSFESEFELKSFVANIETDLDLDMLNEKIEFAAGNKEGNLSYNFIIPENFKLENLLNLNFTVANKFSASEVLISIPVYNPPIDVKIGLDQINNDDKIFVQSFFNSTNLILTNDLLADIGEVEGYSNFKVDELNNFSLFHLQEDTTVIGREIIASNLMIPSEELILNDEELMAANFLSIPNLTQTLTSSDNMEALKVEKNTSKEKIKINKDISNKELVFKNKTNKLNEELITETTPVNFDTNIDKLEKDFSVESKSVEFHKTEKLLVENTFLGTKKNRKELKSGNKKLLKNRIFTKRKQKNILKKNRTDSENTNDQNLTSIKNSTEVSSEKIAANIKIDPIEKKPEIKTTKSSINNETFTVTDQSFEVIELNATNLSLNEKRSNKSKENSSEEFASKLANLQDNLDSFHPLQEKGDISIADELNLK